MNFPISIIIGLIVIAAIIIRAILQSKRQSETADWPSAEGTVERSEVNETSILQGGYWSYDMTYSYSVQGKQYSGTYREPCSLPGAGRTLVERYPTGSKILVRYRPAMPEESSFRGEAPVEVEIRSG